MKKIAITPLKANSAIRQKKNDDFYDALSSYNSDNAPCCFFLLLKQIFFSFFTVVQSNSTA